MIQARDNLDNNHNFSWLSVSEDRIVDDGGGGGEVEPRKWMDIVLPYTQKSSRDASCQNMTMVQVCFALGFLPNPPSIPSPLRVSWSE